MKLCLCFHCLCESYEKVPPQGRELFVSLEDMRRLIEEMSLRGYRFSTPEDPAPDTVSITFDDGYRNNVLFGDMARRYSVPYVLFVSAYYIQSGQGFPWLISGQHDYSEMENFDYYSHHQGNNEPVDATPGKSIERPLTFDELKALANDGLAEIGCHGYYHQPLSKEFQEYLQPEQELSLASLHDGLGIRPRYFSLANGKYTKGVMKNLLRSFDKVFTIEGRPSRPKDRVIHRLTLVNPNIGGPLVQQIDRHLVKLRQLKRAVRTTRRLLI